MERTPEYQKQVNDAAQSLERRDVTQLKDLVRGRFEEERIQILKDVVAQTHQDRKANPNLPNLWLSVRSGVLGWNEENVIEPGGWSSTNLFESQLDIDKLTRNDKTDPVPATVHNIDVRALTTKLESGDAREIPELIKDLKEEERIRLFRDVEKMNAEDRKNKQTDKSLHAFIHASKIGTDEIDVSRAPASPHFWSNTLLYTESLDLNTLVRRSQGYQLTD